MKLQKIEITVVIPSYKEEENLAIIIPEIKKTLEDENINYKILIVDTINPLDDTKSVCEKWNCTYINRELGNNYGDAVRTGIKYAEGEYTLFMDADGSHSPQFIKKMLYAKNQADIVIASRYVEGGDTENPKILILMSWLVNLGYRIVLGIKVRDISNSFKLYKTESLKLLDLKCSNFDIVEEILYKIIKQKRDIVIKEIPFCFKKRLFGETKRNLLVFVFTYFITLIRLRFFT